MHCLLVDGTWECLIFDFSFFSVESCLLCVYQWCGFSRYKFFLLRSQCLADINFLMSSFLSVYSILENVVTKLVVSTRFWSWLLKVSSVVTSLNYSAMLFWFVIVLWVGWRFMGVLCFWFWFSCFLNMSFYVFILEAIFCGTSFFLIFQDIVWLVNSSWYFHWCSIHQFYWISGRCRSEFALWWFFVQKSCRQCWQFFSLFCLDYQTFLEFSQIWRTELLFGVDNAFFTC